ncbi:hypothetical protein BsWGS_23916 [Bradybaena similaris]
MSWTRSMKLASSVCVVYITSVALAYQTDSCQLQCVQEVLKCQQDENMGFFSQMECCDKYTLCYFLCQPDALTAPLCLQKVKRGSWNKRQGHSLRQMWPSRAQLADASSEDGLREDSRFFL